MAERPVRGHADRAVRERCLAASAGIFRRRRQAWALPLREGQRARSVRAVDHHSVRAGQQAPTGRRHHHRHHAVEQAGSRRDRRDDGLRRRHPLRHRRLHHPPGPRRRHRGTALEQGSGRSSAPSQAGAPFVVLRHVTAPAEPDGTGRGPRQLLENTAACAPPPANGLAAGDRPVRLPRPAGHVRHLRMRQRCTAEFHHCVHGRGDGGGECAYRRCRLADGRGVPRPGRTDLPGVGRGRDPGRRLRHRDGALEHRRGL